MKTLIDPGRVHTPVTLREGIIFSHVTDLAGNPLDLPLSFLSTQMLKRDGSDADRQLPTLIWVNGGGWHTTKEMDNMMLPEFVYLAEQGYNVVFFHYRNSDAEGKFPAQIIDLKTCIRFLRANAGRYGVDPDRIGVFGRSAGGHLTSFAAMNTDDFISDEWSGFSSKIQCAIDMFGPTDLPPLVQEDIKGFSDPNARWKSHDDTHTGKLLGTWHGDLDAFLADAAKASPINYISDAMCPIMIMHGNADPMVPHFISEGFYEKLLAHGLGDRVDFYTLEGAGHGTPEFFQDPTKEIIASFFDKHLKG